MIEQRGWAVWRGRRRRRRRRRFTITSSASSPRRVGRTAVLSSVGTRRRPGPRYRGSGRGAGLLRRRAYLRSRIYVRERPRLDPNDVVIATSPRARDKEERRAKSIRSRDCVFTRTHAVAPVVSTFHVRTSGRFVFRLRSRTAVTSKAAPEYYDAPFEIRANFFLSLVFPGPAVLDD